MIALTIFGIFYNKSWIVILFIFLCNDKMFSKIHIFRIGEDGKKKVLRALQHHARLSEGGICRMNKSLLQKTLAVTMAGTMTLSILAPASSITPVKAAELQAAPVTATWNTSYQTMDGVGAAYAYTDSVHMLQLATAGHQDTVRRLLDLTFSEKDGTGHDIVRVIVGDNGGLTTTNATAASPGFNPVTGLLANSSNPGYDIEGNAIPMRGTAGQYGYKMEAENRYYDGNTDSIWPNEPEHAPGTLVPTEGFVWDYSSWDQPVANDDGGPTNLLSASGSDPVVIKNGPRTRKELFDVDQVWTMRQAMQYGVKQFYACTWTVPYWMSNSSTNAPSKIVRADTATIDGKIVKIYYQAYADYLVHYIRGMWEQWGIPITHINPFNEVDLAGGTASYVTELIDGYIGPALKKSMQPGGALYDIKDPNGKIIDFIPQLAAVDGTNLAASISRGGPVFAETDEANALNKNPYLDVFTTHLYGTVGIGTDETKLYHTGDFSQAPLDYTKDGSKYPEYLTRYKLWQAEFMNQDTADGSAGAYTQRYGNQNIYDAVRWSNLLTNMFNSNPGFNGFVWWSMWDSNGADGSDLIRFVTTNSQQEPGRISTLTGEYRLFKRFYGYGHFSRFMKPGDVRFDVTRTPAQDINVVGFKNPNNNDFSITVSNAKNDDSVQPLEFNLKDFPAGTTSVTVFRTSGSENQKKLAAIPVQGGKFQIDIPSASIVTIVPSQGTYATYNGLDGSDGGERDIFSSLEAEGNDNGVRGNTAGNAGRTNEAVILNNSQYLAYKNLNFADGSVNGGVVRRHLLYLTAQAKSSKGGSLQAYVMPVGTTVGSTADIRSKGTKVAEIHVPANSAFAKYQDMVDTGDLSAYGHKDLYIVAVPSIASGTITVDRFLFGANDSDWSTAANNSTVSIPGNLLVNGDFDTATAASTSNWTAGRYNNGTFELSAAGPILAPSEIQSYTGYSRYLKNNSTSKTAGSAKISNRIHALNQYDGMWQEVTGKLAKGEKYNFKGYFLSMQSRSESYDIASENPGDVEAVLVYYDSNGNQLGVTPINERDMPEPYAAREAGDPAYWSNGQLIGRILEGGPLTLSSFQPVDVKVADWHETPNKAFTYEEPNGTAKVVLAVYAKDSNILYADLFSLIPDAIPSYNIFIDGSQPVNFDANTTDYAYTVNGNAVPMITASSSDKEIKVSISQADSTQGTAVVRFIRGQTVLKTYKVAFSTTEVINFANGLPVGWQVANPTVSAVTYSAAGSVTVATYKADYDYPNSHNVLQFPGSAEGNWTLTSKLSANKALSDSSFTDLTQIGLGISRTSTGEYFRINARKVGSSIKINNSDVTGGIPHTNTTNQTSLSGTDYYLRIVKNGNVVQGYYSLNNGLSYLALGSPSTFIPDFFKDAKVDLYATNLSNNDLAATFSNVTIVKTLAEPGDVDSDQLAVEQAAALIGSNITVPNAGSNDPEMLRVKAQELLNQNADLLALGVTGTVSYEGQFGLAMVRGNASISSSMLTINGTNGVDEAAPIWPQGSILQVTEINSTGATLSWTPAQDNVGVTEYKIYNGVLSEPIPVMGSVYRYTVTGLTPNTSYIFSIAAGDHAGNYSTNGPSQAVTTLPAPDTAAPVWAAASSITASNVSTTGLTLTWAGAADDTGITGYKIYKGSDLAVSLDGTVNTYSVTGLTPNTTYEFSVQAGDAANNWSMNGPIVRVHTLNTSSGGSGGGYNGSSPAPAPTPTPTPTTAPKPTPAVSKFKDVGSKHEWAIEAIGTLQAKGIIQGTTESTFSPDQNITRADFVILLVRALGLKADHTSNFADVSQEDYYYEAVGIAKKLGIISGFEDGSFQPKSEITRQDMMVIIARALKAVNKLNAIGGTDTLNDFSDASSIAAYAADSIAALVKARIIQGDGEFIHPAATTTRAEAAVAIFRIYDK
jgi:O-glycosyl hydrolase